MLPCWVVGLLCWKRGQWRKQQHQLILWFEIILIVSELFCLSFNFKPWYIGSIQFFSSLLMMLHIVHYFNGSCIHYPSIAGPGSFSICLYLSLYIFLSGPSIEVSVSIMVSSFIEKKFQLSWNCSAICSSIKCWPFAIKCTKKNQRTP